MLTNLKVFVYGCLFLLLNVSAVPAGETHFYYDGSSRLIRTEIGEVLNEAYEYDDIGNWIEKRVTPGQGFSNTPPDLPQNPTPADKVVDITPDLTLTWTATDPQPEDRLWQSLYFGTALEPPLAAQRMLEPFYKTGLLQSYCYRRRENV